MSKRINQKPRILGLTGGIASGKTTVLNQFKKLGIKTISCDEIARKVYTRANVRKKIKKYFGTLNRKKIAKIIFSDFTKRKQLEKILHPAIIKNLKKQLNLLPSTFYLLPVIVDVPLLFETHLEKMFDKIIVVYCKKNQQISRLMKRDKLTKTEAIRRISAQLPLSKKLKLADIIIDNTKNLLDKII
ncbi:MAG TPA: dephospho-CoA kinase [Elusimicrobia bacterium]|nr:dephospho-CoA kinase [Elusimicrobiota bacterium]